MEQLVKVRQVFADGTAQVMHTRLSACSGDCHKCGGCGAATETMLLQAENPIGARPGDMVRLESETGPVLKAAAMLYVLPLVLFFLGYALGAVKWNHGGLVGSLAFCIGIALVVAYDRHIGKKRRTGYTITGFAEVPQILKKGDNDLG